MKKLKVWRHMIFIPPLPLSQTVTLSQTPSPLWSVTYFMDGPLSKWAVTEVEALLKQGRGWFGSPKFTLAHTFYPKPFHILWHKKANWNFCGIRNISVQFKFVTACHCLEDKLIAIKYWTFIVELFRKSLTKMMVSNPTTTFVTITRFTWHFIEKLCLSSVYWAV